MRLIPFLLILFLITVVVAILSGSGNALHGEPQFLYLLLQIRLPRVLVAALSGASLGLAGVVSQTVFRNPLAAPDILGISAGALCMAIVGLSLGTMPVTIAGGVASASLWAISGALLVLGILLIAQRQGVSLLLLGIGLSSLTTAISSVALSLRRDAPYLATTLFDWLLGHLDGKGWLHVILLFSVFLPLVVYFFRRASHLDQFLLGRELEPPGFRHLFLILAALLTGVVTSITGVISFVALLVPHLARMTGGNHHRSLLLVSPIVGATLVVLADTIARNSPGTSLAPGVVTALIGAPFFFHMLWRYKSDH